MPSAAICGLYGNFSRHGKLSEVIENFRTFALPNEPRPYTFKMKFRYDSWNRIQKMTYPDGEVVRYGYNCGGMLKSVSGNKNGVPSRYIDSIRYNEFELKDTVWYGNGTLAAYAYDSLQRLSRLRSHDGFNSLMQDITYTFDSVGNIIGIANSAPMLPNGLGGTFSQSFSYDNLYRLTGSTGAWRGSDSMYYHSETDYFANGRIMRKQLNARTLINRFVSQTSYNNIYYYENSQQPNTLSRISALEALTTPGLPYRNGNDRNSSSTQQFFWDRNGNLARHNNEQDGLDRRLCWDEQNRLQGVADENYLSYYQYDANGDRTYKLTGRGDLQNISGGWHRFYALDNATLYASPYLVANRQGYTKHYYAESERIASKIGGGGLADFNYPLFEDDSLINKIKSNNRMIDKVFAECLDVGYFETTPVLNPLYDWQDSVQPENDCYWYHPDHLGSTSWITYSDGSAVQHLYYLPWGEDFVNQRSSHFDGVRYTFSAKEKDTETGYSYFGARYYSSDLSIWISVDPQAHKYPLLSPYTYCADNPIKLVDPDGEAIGIPGVKYAFMKASAGAGIGHALSATGIMGIAWDKGGTTRFIAYSTNYFVNQNLNDGSQNPSCIAGCGAGVTLNGFYDWGSSSFKESISKQFLTIDLGVHGALSVTGREKAFGLGGGVGEGGGIDVGNYKIAISISLSSREAKTIRQLSNRIVLPDWQISHQKPIWKKGKITGYQAQIRTYDLSGRPVDTNINVYCGVDSKGRPDNRWCSKAYDAESK